MPTEQEITDATEAAEALAVAKQLFTEAQAELVRAEAIHAAAVTLIDALANDGNDTGWPSLLLLLAANNTDRATRSAAVGSAIATLTSAQSAFDAAIAALQSGP